MPSLMQVDCAPAADRHVTDLLVLWQHPNSREIIPIGRFTWDGGVYEFRYTRAALDISDFRPLPGLNVLTNRYRSNVLPAVFAQRVMRSDRPDYGGYMASLGLDPSLATPWEQIVESGGRREGDTLQFMETPCVREANAHARFFVNGVRHITNGQSCCVAGRTLSVTPDQHLHRFEQLRPGSLVRAEPEENNPEDPQAMVVMSADVPLGWVPRALAPSLQELYSIAGHLPLTVIRVGDPSGPPHLRIVVEMSATVEPGFRFDRAGRWDPIES